MVCRGDEHRTLSLASFMVRLKHVGLGVICTVALLATESKVVVVFAAAELLDKAKEEKQSA